MRIYLYVHLPRVSTFKVAAVHQITLLEGYDIFSVWHGLHFSKKDSFLDRSQPLWRSLGANNVLTETAGSPI